MLVLALQFSKGGAQRWHSQNTRASDHAAAVGREPVGARPTMPGAEGDSLKTEEKIKFGLGFMMEANLRHLEISTEPTSAPTGSVSSGRNECPPTFEH